MPFYNCHIHCFSAECAPEHFLKVGDNWFLRHFSKPVKTLLETRVGRALVKSLSRLPGKSGAVNAMARYGSFAEIGTRSKQRDIFENIRSIYPPETRFVVLTLNMDFMGAGRALINYQAQVNQVIEMRKTYPDTCLPFFSIDPRMSHHPKGILEYVERYVGPQKPFVGIKLYPALGFFPYDHRLELMYEYCEQHQVPIMTHCDPGGSFYLGRMDAIMGCPGCITYQGYAPPAVSFPTRSNNQETEQFLAPHTWDVVFARFPRLKVCFAHMGGSEALHFNPEAAPRTAAASSLRWFLDIKDLMAAFPNVYTDVSYTLHKEKNWKKILAMLEGNSLLSKQPGWLMPAFSPPPAYKETIKDRLLFGTDYFMTEREKSEKVLAVALPGWLLREKKEIDFRPNGRAYYEALTAQNPEAYLRSTFYQP